MDTNLVIGLVGSFGSGCTTTYNLLTQEKKDFNFFGVSLSDYLKFEILKSYPDFNNKESKEKRRLLQDLGNIFRKKYGPEYLAKMALVKIESKIEKEDVIIDSIKNPAEIKEFKKHFKNFYLITVDTDLDKRWQRIKQLYNNDYERFQNDDRRDTGEEEPNYGQQVKKCITYSDFLLSNNTNFFNYKGKKDLKAINDFGDKVKDIINLLKNPGEREPNFDEIYMSQTYMISLRSMCMRRKVGATIVSANYDNDNKLKESFIVSQSCNNAPINAKSCRDLSGCQRGIKKEEFITNTKYCRKCGNLLLNDKKKCNNCGNVTEDDIPSRILDICRAIHAEEAAILEAGMVGIPLKDKILYTTTFPCLLCAKEIIKTEIRKVIYLESYPSKESFNMLRECNVDLHKYEGVFPRSFYKLFK